MAHGRISNLDSVVALPWALPLLTAGLAILLIQRSALAYWATLMLGGGWLYLASTTYLDTSDWVVQGEIMALTLVLCGILFSTKEVTVNHAAVLLLGLLSFAIWGALAWSQQGAIEDEYIRATLILYQEHIPRVQEIALEASCVLGAVWVLHRLRSEDPAVRAHLLMTGGLILLATESAWSWAALLWRTKILTIGGILVAVGLAVYIVNCFARKRYMTAIFISLLIGIGGQVILTTWQDRLQPTLLHLDLAHIFMIGMILTAAAALTTGVVDTVFSAAIGDSNVPSLIVKSSRMAWTGITTTVLSLICIAKFEIPSIGNGLLTLLAVAGCMFFLWSVWAAALLIADDSFMAAVSDSASLRELWLMAIVRGPKDFGYGPSLALSGTVLIAVLGILPEWEAFPVLRLVAAALLVAGLTSISRTIMIRLQESSEVQYAADPSSHRLEHMADQVRLVPIGVAAGTTATTLMFVVTADIWLWIRIMLALIASAGFVVAAFPLLYALAAPPLRRLNITLQDVGTWFIEWLEGDDMLKALRTHHDSKNATRIFALGSAFGLCVGVMSIVFSAAFELYLVLEIILTAAAIVGIASTLVLGWLMQDRISFMEEDDLLARTRSFTHSKRATFRLLPELNQVNSPR